MRLSLHRHPVVVLRSVSDAWAAGAQLAGCVLVDLENTIVPYSWYDDPSVAAEELAAFVSATRGSCVVVISNSPRAGDLWRNAVPPIPVVARARKPFTRRRTIERASGGLPPAAVIGDQYLTDGLLALRLGVPFYVVDAGRRGEPAWPTLMRAVGRLVARVLFGPAEAV